MDDEDEKSDEEELANGVNGKGARHGGKDDNDAPIMKTRTRGAKNKQVNHQIEADLKKSQNKLLEEKLQELKQRYENGEIIMSSKKQKQKDMGKIQSYSSIKKFPSDLKKGQLYVDEKNDTILLPINQD